MQITDFLQAGAKWLNTARKAVVIQPVLVKTEDGDFECNATVVQANQMINPGQVAVHHDVFVFLFDHQETKDINFKRGVTLIWNENTYDLVINMKIQNEFNDQFQYDRVVPAKLVR